MNAPRRMYFVAMWAKIALVFTVSMTGVWFVLHHEDGVPIALAIIGLMMVDIVITRELMRRFARDSR